MNSQPEKERIKPQRMPMPGPGGRGGRGPGDKPADFKGSMLKLVRFIKPYLVVILIAILCDMSGVILRLSGPHFLSEITNKLTAGIGGVIDIQSILNICYLLCILYGLGTLLALATGLIMTFVTQRINKQLRSSISQKINRLPIAYYQSSSTGDILSRVTNDVDTIGQTTQNSISSFMSGITMFLGSMVMMFATNAIMALSAIVSAFLGFALMSLIMARSQKYFVVRQKSLGALNGHVEEIYTGHSIVRLFNGVEKEKKTFNELNDQMYQGEWKSQFLSGLMQPLMGFVGNLSYVTVCVVGAAMAMGGHIQFGTIVAFMVYVRQFTGPLGQLAQVATSFQSAAAAAERVFDFLGAPEMSDERNPRKLPSRIVGEVEFKSVSFSYPNNPEKIIIKHFSQHIRPGQKVAIVGPTGAGKTTLVNLLMRFYEVNSGEILIDGIPTNSLSRADVHKCFGMVLQDTWLFSGTIRENLLYGKTDVPEKQLNDVLKAVGMKHFVQTLSNGIDTMIDEKMSLSAGQKQLLTIARAMIENAPMLILDEATSSVDTRTEVLIQSAMDKLTQGRTSFVIAHRLSTIKNADLILVMQDGDIVESGHHQELLALNGFYAKLYNSQFEVA